MAAKLIKIYFSFFKVSVNKGEVDTKLMKALLTGVNRAFPYARLEPGELDQQMETMHKLVHLVSFNVSIHPLSSDVKALVKEDWKEVDSNVYQFSQLPEVVGTGEKYRVSVQSVYTSPTGQVTRSQPTTEICFTKPLPPRELKVLDDDKQIISWQKSQSPSVRMYKVKIRKENEKAQDFIHEVDERQSDCQFQIPELDLMVEYKLNIYSVLMHGEHQVVESEPLFAMGCPAIP